VFLTTEISKFKGTSGRTDKIKHHIQLTDTTPIKQRYRPRNPAMQDIISPWSSPIVMVEKKDGKQRFCIDFRKVNESTQKDAYPLPMISAILDKLRRAKYFSTIDLKQGYWQVELTHYCFYYTRKRLILV